MLRVVTTGDSDPLEGAWASRSAASVRCDPARGAAAVRPRAPQWPSTQDSGAGRWLRGHGRATAPARAATACARPPGHTPGLRPGGTGGRHLHDRRERLGRGARRLDAAPRGAQLRRARRRRGRRPAGPRTHGADGAAAGPGDGDTHRSDAVLRRPRRRGRTAGAPVPDGLGRRGSRPAGAGPGVAHHGSAVRPRRPGAGPVAAPPVPDTAVAPPQARLLLGTLAYICHRW